MKIEKKIDILEDKITATVACTELGTDSMDAETEKETLEDFVKKLKYADITFSTKMKYVSESKTFEDLGDETEDPLADEVALGIINKEIPINENFNASITIDATKIKEDLSGNNSIKTADLMAQAQAKLFVEKVTEKLKAMLEDIHKNTSTIEGSDEVTL